MSDALHGLQDWFLSQCDGDWEHGEGITIETLDNPGWRVRISLECTPLAGKDFQKLKEEYDSDDEWLRCWVKDDCFHVACGPLRLADGLNRFLAWTG